MIKYLNSKEMCMICFHPPDVNPELNLLGETVTHPLLKHHVSYYPEIIAFVHYDCHKKIHNTPLDIYIQYKTGDSRKFYDERKKGK